MPITPLTDTEFAEDYFGDRLNVDEWDEADDDTKEKALRHATHLINRLAFIGGKTGADQESEFPRNGDSEVPNEVQQATCEVALELLRGKFQETEDEQRVGVRSESIGDASRTYSDKGADLYSENGGLPSKIAFDLLSPWLIDPKRVRLVRAS